MNSSSSHALGGAGRVDVSDLPSEYQATAAGQFVGGFVSIGADLQEIVLGTGGEFGGSFAGPSMGSSLSVSVVSAGVVVHGIILTGTAVSNVGDSFENMLSFASGSNRNRPPESDPGGRPHSIIEHPGKSGQYTTHNGDGTWKPYRGSGKDHRTIPRPNVKETKPNKTPNGDVFRASQRLDIQSLKKFHTTKEV